MDKEQMMINLVKMKNHLCDTPAGDWREIARELKVSGEVAVGYIVSFSVKKHLNI